MVLGNTNTVLYSTVFHFLAKNYQKYLTVHIGQKRVDAPLSRGNTSSTHEREEGGVKIHHFVIKYGYVSLD